MSGPLVRRSRSPYREYIVDERDRDERDIRVFEERDRDGREIRVIEEIVSIVKQLKILRQ